MRVSGPKILLVVVIILFVILVISIIGGYTRKWAWTGLVSPQLQTSSSNSQQEWKTLWDWMELLIVPLFLVIGVGIFNWSLRKREEFREDLEREQEQSRSQKIALQTYLDKMTDLLLAEGLRDSPPDSEVRKVARARTITALAQLKGYHKGSLLRFLYESGLILRSPRPHNPIIDLTGARFEKAGIAHAYLKGAYLRGALFREAGFYVSDLRDCDLRDTVMAYAKLQNADLRGADLSGAQMAEAKMRHTKLSGAILNQTILSGAELDDADLRGVDLRNASLAGADLTHANLEGAILEEGQLDDVLTLDGAILPDGSKVGVDKP